MKTITIGMVGFGFMGKMHTYGYKTIPLYYEDLPFDIRLKWVCTSNEETAKKAMVKGGFENCTTNFDDLINDESVDVIDICTPNSLHKEEIIKALKKGKKVYCDKPLTVTYDEAREVVLTEKETGNDINQVTFHNRFYPAVIKASSEASSHVAQRLSVFHMTTTSQRWNTTAYMCQTALDAHATAIRL